MQRTKKQEDYRNNNSWSTVVRKNKRKKKTKQEKDGKHEKLRIQGIQGKQCNTEVKDHEHQPIPIKHPSLGRAYANMVIKSEHEPENITTNEVNTISKSCTIIPKCPRANERKETVSNQVPQLYTNASYGVWEHTYFQHVLNLAKIFSNGTRNLGIQTNTIDFLDTFSHFIRDVSTGQISPYIEELNKDTDEFYLNFIN